MIERLHPFVVRSRARWPDALLLVFITGVASGCESGTSGSTDPWTNRRDALAFLKQAIQDSDNPVVRAQAIEVIESAAPRDGLPWIRRALDDSHEGVRFAACLALGALQDDRARSMLERRVDDESENVQVGALFALHRLGDGSRSHRLAEFLLYSSEASVRANTALVLGRLGEPGAAALLRRAMNDNAPAVRLSVFEGLLQLGDKTAGEQLTVHAHGGPGAWQVTALLALARSDLPNKLRLLRRRLQDAQHIEIRLAAARGLGWCGHSDGYDVARQALGFRSWRPTAGNPEDVAKNQMMRIRSMAALALGAIGDDRAVATLRRLMDTTTDPRVKVAAAAALLEVLTRALPALPFADD